MEAYTHVHVHVHVCALCMTLVGGGQWHREPLELLTIVLVHVWGKGRMADSCPTVHCCRFLTCTCAMRTYRMYMYIRIRAQLASTLRRQRAVHEIFGGTVWGAICLKSSSHHTFMNVHPHL